MNVHVEPTIAMLMQIVEIQLGVLRVFAEQGLEETEKHARVSNQKFLNITTKKSCSTIVW